MGYLDLLIFGVPIPPIQISYFVLTFDVALTVSLNPYKTNVIPKRKIPKAANEA